MADSLDALKEKIRMEHRAYGPANGIVDLDGFSESVAGAIAARLNITDMEEIHQLQRLVETIVTIKSAVGGKDENWCSEDEWVEACGRYMFKHPRNFVMKWKNWYTHLFDVLDQDHDGYIDKDQFLVPYLGSRKEHDEEFLAGAFAAVDTEKAGKVSRKQFVTSYTKYISDPDITLPLF